MTWTARYGLMLQWYVDLLPGPSSSPCTLYGGYREDKKDRNKGARRRGYVSLLYDTMILTHQVAREAVAA